MSDPLDLAPIKDRLAAAAPGPWQLVGDDWGDARVLDGEGNLLALGPYGGAISAPDGRLIAGAPTDIAALIAEVERLRGAE